MLQTRKAMKKVGWPSLPPVDRNPAFFGVFVAFTTLETYNDDLP